MVEYILGNYLVETGKITKSQLQQVLESQDAVRVKLGLIAVEEGMMTMDQADEVNRLQAVMDKRFGDIAVTRGYLTEEQVGRLLKRQGSPYLVFVQSLVDAGLVTMEEVDGFINDFRHINGYSISELEDIKSDDVDRILPLMLPEGAKQYRDVIGAAVRILIRLIDRRVYLREAVMVTSLPPEPMVSQTLDGESGIVDCFSERDGALLKACRVFGQEEFETLNEDSLDAAGELLNCINGLYVSNLSRQGRFLEMMPPVYAGVRETVKPDSICRVPIFVGGRGLYFTVAEII